ncbi:MAG: UDP-N-acetylmuramoylalanyl-D-glutamyl-2,6-diaminopimelate--D-alanyl-D-alanine ligase [Rickettsiales bacterium]|jgi:UDP-N-acetylmuramoyl-tripeptide--D-alanyl-D-alanine ligase|nr:UDP-N-acetylmuramoylalanyl-D-glutamyl-2,6-diaminopimelate--D-alanyl-D-alanine ligase [Rickettsiales bacterium]
MTVLWTSETAEKATGGISEKTWKASSVSINSRTIEPGSLFVALKGEKFDAHDYVRESLEKGAAAVVVSHRPNDVPADAPLLVVKDTEAALRALGSYKREKSNAKIFGVTGSVGKTSVKEMLSVATSALGKTYATEGNLNNHLGTPLSLSRMADDLDFAVMEMGMNHVGEIRELTALVRPHVVIITTVEAVHLEFFSSVEQIAVAKAEIFEGLEPGGTAILNRDNSHYALLAEKAKAVGVKHIISFGEHKEAECRLVSYTPEEGGGQVEAQVGGKRYRYHLPIRGKHQACNSLAVLAAIQAVGGDVGKSAKALEGYQAGIGRGKRVVLPGGGLLIDDCYNASPASVRAALAAMETPKAGGRKIAVLGDMLELGETRKALHAGLLSDVIANGIEKVYTAGESMQALYNALPEGIKGAEALSSALLAPIVKEAVKPGDVVLVKGSNGMKMRVIIEALLQSVESNKNKVAG